MEYKNPTKRGRAGVKLRSWPEIGSDGDVLLTPYVPEGHNRKWWWCMYVTYSHRNFSVYDNYCTWLLTTVIHDINAINRIKISYHTLHLIPQNQYAYSTFTSANVCKNIYTKATSAHPFWNAHISYKTDPDMPYTHVHPPVNTPHPTSHTHTHIYIYIYTYTL